MQVNWDKVADQAKWNRMARVSTIEPTAKQKEVQARWDMERRLGGTHSAKARTQAHFDAIDAERRKREQARWLVGQERAKQQDIIQGEVDKANATGKWQAQAAKETARGAIEAANAPYSDQAIKYNKEKDAIDAAREEKQHARAIEIKKMDDAAATRSAAATASLKQMELANTLAVEQEKTTQEIVKHGDEKQKEAFSRYKDLTNLRIKAENSGLDEEDLRKLDILIDAENADKTPEERLAMKQAMRAKSKDPKFIEVLTQEIAHYGKQAGLNSY